MGTDREGVIVDVPAAGVYRLRIDHPARRGALSTAVLDSLATAVTETPDDARCLLLTGSGTTFSAGYDLRALGSAPDPEFADAEIAPDKVAVFDLLERQPCPVVAALNGPAVGGGLELALACDIRLAAPTASLGAPAGRLGLVYSPGGLERIVAELPFALAAELFLAGGTLSAERAREVGLISRVVAAEELDAAAVELARQVAQLASQATQANRAALRALRRTGGRLDGADRARLLSARARGMRSAEFAEGVAAFLGRRSAAFAALDRAAD